jgi:hypothetical protein
MPWTADDAHKHNKGLTAKEARQWAAVANSAYENCMKNGGSDETCAPKAIRMANGVVKKSVDGDDSLYTLVLKQDAPLRYTLGIVYEPLETDSQGDFAKAATIQTACWEFMRRLQSGKTLTKWAMTLLDAITKAVDSTMALRIDVTDMVDEITKAKRALGDQHSSWDEGLGEIVECYCMPCDGEVSGEVVKQGTWMLGVVWSEDYFAKIQAGERTGYSMGGKARTQWVEEMAHA